MKFANSTVFKIRILLVTDIFSSKYTVFCRLHRLSDAQKIRPQCTKLSAEDNTRLKGHSSLDIKAMILKAVLFFANMFSYVHSFAQLYCQSIMVDNWP